MAKMRFRIYTGPVSILPVPVVDEEGSQETV
jgi:hypothetical protein